MEKYVHACHQEVIEGQEVLMLFGVVCAEAKVSTEQSIEGRRAEREEEESSSMFECA